MRAYIAHLLSFAIFRQVRSFISAAPLHSTNATLLSIAVSRQVRPISGTGSTQAEFTSAGGAGGRGETAGGVVVPHPATSTTKKRFIGFLQALPRLPHLLSPPHPALFVQLFLLLLIALVR